MPYVKPKVARETLGVSDDCLRKWAEQGKISSLLCSSGHRLYDVEDFLRGKGRAKERRKYIYCRVSSNKQKEDLERQISYLQEKYPGHKVYKEIASGINFKRKVLLRILEDVLEGGVEEIVVAHRDRLCWIAWELFVWLCSKHGTSIVVDGNDNHATPEVELAEDLLSIVHVFSCRHYGQRRRCPEKRVRRSETESIEEEENE